METIPSQKPFYLKERLAEQLKAVDFAAESDDLQDNPEVEDDEPSLSAQPAFPGDASPVDYILGLIPEPPSSFQPVPASILQNSAGPIRTKTDKNTRKDSKNRAKRALLRAKQKQPQDEPSDHAIRRCQGSEPLLTEEFSLQEDAEVGSGGYAGKRTDFERVHSTVAELEALGLKKVEWDPRCVASCQTFFVPSASFPSPSKSYALLDSEGYVCGVLGGYPQNTNWDGVNDEACNAIRDLRSKLHFNEKQVTNRRFDCPTVSFGVSFGGGAKVKLKFFGTKIPTPFLETWEPPSN